MKKIATSTVLKIFGVWYFYISHVFPEILLLTLKNFCVSFGNSRTVKIIYAIRIAP